ncbi:hypothetical protein V6N11_033402 [Hibiscus sabdariffa]|uniref:Uncharacterized protein n=1 Tax=Hibiscus sabdariffa TaxID=183260 RepID=A0ABR2PYJ2_9ROSI
MGWSSGDGDKTVEVGLDEGHERLASLDIQQNETIVDWFQRSNYDIRTILNVSGDFGDLCKGVLVKQRGQPQDDGDETVEVGLDEGYERLASLDIQKNK